MRIANTVTAARQAETRRRDLAARRADAGRRQRGHSAEIAVLDESGHLWPRRLKIA